MLCSQAGDIAEQESTRNAADPVPNAAEDLRQNQIARADAIDEPLASAVPNPHGRQAKKPLKNSLIQKQRNEARPGAGRALD